MTSRLQSQQVSCADVFSDGLYIVISIYSGHFGDLHLVPSLARVRNSESLFQSNVCNIFLDRDLAAVRIIGVSVIAGCPQGESWL